MSSILFRARSNSFSSVLARLLAGARPFSAPLFCCLAIAGCARTADQIPPASSAVLLEAAPSCDALTRRRAQVAEQLIFASIEQNQVAREDRERLFGIAPSMFGTLFRGDVSARIAGLKAEVLETDAQLAGMGCVAPPR